MLFKEFYKKGCEAGYITDTTINEDSYKSVVDAIEAGIITDVVVANSLLSQDGTPEIIDGKASVDSVDSAKKAIEAGATELNITADLNEPISLDPAKDMKLVFSEKQSAPVSVNSDCAKTLEISAEKGLCELNINAPSTTVNLNSGEYTKINSKTAQNTLVLKPGVIVNDLNVLAGNILAHKGSSVKKATKDKSNNSTFVIYTEGAPSGVDVPKAEKDVFEVLQYKLSNVIDRGGKFVLTDNVKLAPTSSSEFFGEVDLNGFTLSVNGMVGSALVSAGKTLKIYNGNINTTNYKAQHAVFKTSSNSTIDFNKVQFDTEGTNVYADGAEAHVIVNDSKFNGFYTIATNASTPDHMTIDLNRSQFDGMSTIFVNVPCDLNVDKCIINGQMHSMIVRGGNANVSDTKITQEYKDADFAEMANYFNDKDWASGNTINLGGLVMGNKNTTAYKYPTTVNLKNTEITVKGHDDLFPAVYAWSYEFPVTFNYDEKCKFNGRAGLVYGNEGNNITVNGTPVKTVA